MLVGQVSSSYLTSLPLSVLLVVTTQYPWLRECKAPSGTSLLIGYEPWVSVFWMLLPKSSLHAYSKDALLSLWHKVNCWIVFVMFNKMPNIFSGSSVVFVLSHTMFYMCLTLLALVGSLVLGNPWYTRSFALILISETHISFIHYVTNPTRRHIGVQIRTADTLHTLAY